LKIVLNNNIVGSILDIGGGGEGIISRVYGSQVVAIDNKVDELNEFPEGTIKIVMDARKMAFTNGCFDNITAFYSFMYMSKYDHIFVLSEIKRVLKPNGHLYIWDTSIVEANPFITDLEIKIGDMLINTSYGISKANAHQSPEYFRKISKESGFELISENISNGHFYQHWMKL